MEFQDQQTIILHISQSNILKMRKRKIIFGRSGILGHLLLYLRFSITWRKGRRLGRKTGARKPVEKGIWPLRLRSELKLKQNLRLGET